MRKSVYLRDKMDDDILEVVKPLLKNHSFAHVMRELARDGIKYRKGGEVLCHTKSYKVLHQNNQLQSLISN